MKYEMLVLLFGFRSYASFETNYILDFVLNGRILRMIILLFSMVFIH